MKKLLVVLGLLGSSLYAETLSVYVGCNGSPVPNLSVIVRDSESNEIPDLYPTDSEGIFQIPNSENYAAPFYLFFLTPQNSQCGGYYIDTDSNGNGQVQLNYYPTTLPCSCSHLLPE